MVMFLVCILHGFFLSGLVLPLVIIDIKILFNVLIFVNILVSNLAALDYKNVGSLQVPFEPLPTRTLCSLRRAMSNIARAVECGIIKCTN